jgi:hypothetical protein
MLGRVEFEILTVVTEEYSLMKVQRDITASIFKSQSGLACQLLFACYLLGLLFDPEDGGSVFLQNVSELIPDYTVSHPRTQYSALYSADTKWKLGA